MKGTKGEFVLQVLDYFEKQEKDEQQRAWFGKVKEFLASGVIDGGNYALPPLMYAAAAFVAAGGQQGIEHFLMTVFMTQAAREKEIAA